ncbi:PREDICTED: nuclear pore complex protein DDB_G0274915-like [Dufourea novaeangliae]|uniref:nuclear pore complex protein DDB_G0274915-like n=1 Tax=Dufourea novaeangliae TaxID=178035 RepID=UPI000767B50D|nr:PREDICTED: nuclear pore complex protein DDB_G0274915-like [Dufourea novaeangliae]
MVVCKYYRQGNCRFGQYCQFEHINTFGSTPKVDSYNQDEFTAVAVAKEVLCAERGGQWLLSCFAPLKQKPPIPGMEDLSPEEVRWEMYQAQKNGMVEQAKLRFQQLCQDIKAKRDALKNPTRETIEMLKELQGTGQKSLPGSTPTSNVFGNKTFGSQSSPFSGGFTPISSTSIFGRTTTSNPVFGGTPNFGSGLGFGSGTSTNSVFGGTTSTTTTFNTGQTAQAFGNTSSIFGAGASQSVFVQPSVFGASSLVNNAFARPQTSQAATPGFSGVTSAPSLFSISTSQSSSSMFGGAKTSTANLFGSSATLQTTNSVFGTTAPSGAFSSGMFSQSKPAFGGAPVFGSAANFGNANGPMYGEQPAFGASNIFGGSNTNAPTFSSAAQSTNTFGATASTSSAVNLFGNIQTTPAISTSNAAPFGTATPTTSSPFASGTSQFEANSSTASPFSRTTFGITTSANETVGTTVTSSTIPFGITNTGLGFGTSSTTTSTFGEVKNSPFATTNTTATTTTTNPFALRTQQITSPFGNFTQSQLANTTTVSTSGPFGKSPFSVTMTVAVVDDSVYSAVDQLTDDEKSMYMAEKFAFGKIPLKPPPKDMR